MKLVSELLGKIRVTRCRATVSFGTDDPSETGRIYGFIVPVIYGSSWAWATPDAIQVHPVFDGARFECEGEFALDTILVSWLPPLVRFAWDTFGRRR